MHRSPSTRLPPPSSPSPLYRQRGFEISPNAVSPLDDAAGTNSPTAGRSNSYVNPLMLHNAGSSNASAGTYDFRTTSHNVFDETLSDLVNGDQQAQQDAAAAHAHNYQLATDHSGTQSPSMASAPHPIPSVPRYFQGSASQQSTSPGGARYRASPYSQSGASSGVISPNSGSVGYGTDFFSGLDGGAGDTSQYGGGSLSTTVDDVGSFHDASSSPAGGKAMSSKSASRHGRRYSASGGVLDSPGGRSGSNASNIVVKAEPVPMTIPPSPSMRANDGGYDVASPHHAQLPYSVPAYASHQRTPTMPVGVVGGHPQSAPWLNDPNLTDSSSLFGSAPGSGFYPQHPSMGGGYGPGEASPAAYGGPRGFIPSSAPATSTAFPGMAMHGHHRIGKLADVGEESEQYVTHDAYYHGDPNAMNSSTPPPRKELLEKMEKRKEKRRVSHNLVERRRRDNINNQIHELANLLPAVYLEAAITPIGMSSSVRSNDGDPGFASPSGTPMSAGLASPPTSYGYAKGMTAAMKPGGPPNKGIVLSKSVEYIRHLLEIVQAQNNRNRNLAAMVRQLGGNPEGFGGDDDAYLHAATTGNQVESLGPSGAVAPEFLAAFAQHMTHSTSSLGKHSNMGPPSMSREHSGRSQRDSGGSDDADGDEQDEQELDDDAMQT